jgi:hypothetical protein
MHQRYVEAVTKAGLCVYKTANFGLATLIQFTEVTACSTTIREIEKRVKQLLIIGSQLMSASSSNILVTAS